MNKFSQQFKKNRARFFSIVIAVDYKLRRSDRHLTGRILHTSFFRAPSPSFHNCTLFQFSQRQQWTCSIYKLLPKDPCRNIFPNYPSNTPLLAHKNRIRIPIFAWPRGTMENTEPRLISARGILIGPPKTPERQLPGGPMMNNLRVPLRKYVRMHVLWQNTVPSYVYSTYWSTLRATESFSREKYFSHERAFSFYRRWDALFLLLFVGLIFW